MRRCWDWKMSSLRVVRAVKIDWGWAQVKCFSNVTALWFFSTSHQSLYNSLHEVQKPLFEIKQLKVSNDVHAVRQSTSVCTKCHWRKGGELMAFLASQPEAEQMNQTLSSTQGFTVSTPGNKTCDAVLVIVTLLSADAPWSGLFSLKNTFSRHSNSSIKATRACIKR